MKKGFTLTELLGVVTLLGLIMIVAFPPLLRQLKSSEETIDDALEQVIIASTSNYLDENKNDFLRVDGNVYCVTLQTLVDDNKLSKDLKDSNGDEIDLNKYVEVSVSANKYEYLITDSCTEVK